MKKFIVIDGLDGSGKDTQVNLIAEAYQKKGRDVTIRSHPCNDNKFGRKSKAALLKTGKLNHIKATIYFGLDAVRVSARRLCLGSTSHKTGLVQG